MHLSAAVYEDVSDSVSEWVAGGLLVEGRREGVDEASSLTADGIVQRVSSASLES